MPTFIRSLVKEIGTLYNRKTVGMVQAYIGNDVTRTANKLHSLMTADHSTGTLI
jgi:hypothetical protein